MSGWLRFENSTAENRKLVPLSDRAFRLWFNACCYCSRNETDGLVPKAIITRLSRTATRTTVEELVGAGRLELVDAHTYRVHDYLNHNPSRARLAEMRASGKGRTARWRDGAGDAIGDASHIRHSRADARNRSVDVPSLAVPSSSTTDVGANGSRASRRVDQDQLPESLPAELHSITRSSLSVLQAVHAERGGDEPTLRGVGLAIARFSNRDHARVVRELEHWALAGSGQRKPVKDWARTFATFLDSSPTGAPRKAAGSGGVPDGGRFSEYDRAAGL